MSNVSIDKSKWESLSADEQKKIIEGLTKVGTLQPGDNIIGELISPLDSGAQPAWDPVGDVCRGACDVAAGVGAAWCTANTSGVALVVCMAAADAVRSECRNKC